MIYICIPARDESRTIGVLLWKIRKVMLDLGRDYQIFVLDDGSQDDTPSVLDRYRRVLPLAVLREDRPIGYGAATEKLLRTAAEHSDYPKRDAIVVMQGDFTEHPDSLTGLVKSFEGGADIVAGRPDASGGGGAYPWPVRLARRISRALLPNGRRDGSETSGDALCGFRAYRTVVVRKALAASSGRPLVTRQGWAASAQLLAALTPFARRIAEVPVSLRYDLRGRSTRVRVWKTSIELLRLRRVARKDRRRRPGPLAAASLPVILSAAAMIPTAPAAAQITRLPLDSLTTIRPAVTVPFQVGESLKYKVRALFFDVGEGRMGVPRIDTVNGAPVYAAEWHIKGSFLGYSIDSKFYSWMDEKTLVSRRFMKDQREGGRTRYREYDFFPEERRWHRIDYDSTGALPTSMPLDDVSFVYFARTLPLEVGKTYTLNRYFKGEGNPVVIKVLRKDRREVGAGVFNTIVVEPIIKTRGLFSEGGEAEIHFSDDERRLIVYMRTNLPLVGSLSLHLEEIETPNPPSPPGGAP